MERRIGEIFEYQGKILRVKEAEGKICEGCLFLNKCTCETKGAVGWCDCGTRSDKKNVIFVEVKEQQETETVKERKIGEKFDYYGKTLEVVETKSDTCYQCCFKEETGRCSRIKSKTGLCDMHKRSDRRPVIFVEVKKDAQKESEAIKERKIGEVFDYDGKKLRVEEFRSDCVSCFFDGQCSKTIKETTGACGSSIRKDGKNVIFAEVPPQKDTEEPKERKVGEVFEYEGRKLKVMEETDGCTGCYFREYSCHANRRIIGECIYNKRSNNKGVIFIDITDESANKPQTQEQTEQPHEEPQKLNLCEILKNCPKGTEFWSPMLGNVKLNSIDHAQQRVYVILETGANWYINSDATITLDYVTSAEIMLYPSREQRDWSKVKYEPKKELPRTWVEFCKNYPCKKDECFITSASSLYWTTEGAERQVYCDKNFLPNRQAAEAHLAYMQLHQLRDAWREGWLPDWKDDMQAKFSIVYNNGEYSVFDYQYVSRFLSFQDKDRAKEFLECFKDLIKKAGDLI